MLAIAPLKQTMRLSMPSRLADRRFTGSLYGCDYKALPKLVEYLLYRQNIAAPKAKPLSSPVRHFQYPLRSPTSEGHAKGTKGCELDQGATAIDVQHIYREPHEEGMD
jgi:hypothetical protein